MKLLLLLFPLSLFASVAEPNVIWGKKMIRVCWGSVDNIDHASFQKSSIRHQYASEEFLRKHPFEYFNKSQMKIVQNTIQTAFTPQRTGIYFVDWSPCPFDKETLELLYDAIVFGTNMKPHNLVGLSVIGENGKYTYRGYKKLPRKEGLPFVFLTQSPPTPVNQDTPNFQLSRTSVHEFGHLAGLRHERARGESEKDLNCHLTDLSERQEYLSRGTKLYGPYDPYSIMNDCFYSLAIYHTGSVFFLPYPSNYFFKSEDPLVVKKEKVGTFFEYKITPTLSRGDLQTLKALYP